MLGNFNIFALVILLFTAAFYDLKEKRIPNIITFPIIIVGLILNIIMNGLNGCLFSLNGFFIGLAVFFIPFAFGFMGAGDVKLMGAIGALMGWEFTALSTLFSSIAGFGLVFVYLIYKKRLFRFFKKYFLALVNFILRNIYFSDRNIIGNKLKKISYSNVVENQVEAKLYVPYGLAIALGTLFVLSGIWERYLFF